MPYSPESVSILIRFQSQVPRTIMHFTSVILTFLRCCAASCSNAAGSEVAPQAAVFIKDRRFIVEFPLGRILLWTGQDCHASGGLNLPFGLRSGVQIRPRSCGASFSMAALLTRCLTARHTS